MWTSNLITFGTTSVQFIGKKTDGSKFPLAHTSFSNTARQIGTLTINAQDAVNQGVRELSFDVLTKTSGKADYTLMFSSDYRDAYDSHQAINTNPLYQDWLNWGNPVRTSGQNPLQDPKHYWPYVLKLKPVLGCPYVYAWNGAEFVEDNTILPTSEGEEGVVVDFYKIETPLELQDDKYAIEIREFEQERTYLDAIELFAVDHPSGINIGTTPDGEILVYKEILMPSSCIDNNGNSQLSLVENSGDGHFEGADGDWLTVNFGEVSSGDKAVILAAPPPKEASVVAEVNDGSDWKTVGTVYPRGKESVSLVRIPEHGSGNSLEVRLLCKGNARIDYVALTNLVEGETKIKECALASALHSSSEDIIKKLRRVDLDYAELVPGDTIRLDFESPKQINDWQRDFVLVSTGYYEHIESTGGTMSSGSEVPLSAFRICGSYPNPFNSAAQIKFAVPEKAQVNLGIYDVTGRLVKTLVSERLEAGYHTVTWHPKGLVSGIYFVKLRAHTGLETDNYTKVKKLILVR